MAGKAQSSFFSSGLVVWLLVGFRMLTGCFIDHAAGSGFCLAILFDICLSFFSAQQFPCFCLLDWFAFFQSCRNG